MPRTRSSSVLSFFREVPLSSAADLLDALAPHRGGDLWTHQETDWLFRGQADAAWDLKAAAQRPGAFGPFMEAIGRGYQRLASVKSRHTLTLAQRIDLEHHAVMAFGSVASSAGLEVAGDGQDLRDGDRRRQAIAFERFPPAGLRGMYALAQHHGVPTRLLDWTFSPLVAGYFAAVEPARAVAAPSSAKHSSGRFAIWALNTQFLRTEFSRWDPGATFVTVPTHNNPNLRAQQGVFTLVRFLKAPPPNVDIPTVDELLVHGRHSARRRRRSVPSSPVLLKLTVPQAEAGTLLRLLDSYNIGAATLFPGYDSVSRHLRELAFHKRATAPRTSPK